MIDLSTGGVVGIDFGHAFGTATQVSVRYVYKYGLFSRGKYFTNARWCHYSQGKFHECMAVTSTATLNSAHFHREIFHELSSVHKIREIFPLENNVLYDILLVLSCAVSN